MTRDGTRPIGVIASRYGRDVLGGAETVLRELALGLRSRGVPVEVLSTTSVDLYRPTNALPAGLLHEEGIPVRRFRVVPPERGPDLIGHRILSGETVPVLEQMQWMNTGTRSPEFFDFLTQHAAQYHTLICAPYMSWMSFAAAELAADRIILMPCLHDEPFARLDLFRSEFEDVRGLWFLSDPERDLANQLFTLPTQTEVIGSGIELPGQLDPGGFRQRHDITGDFLVYAGRREWMKGWHEMVGHLGFTAQLLGREITLVTCGAGEVGPEPRGVRIVDLGFVSDSERWNALAAATACLQPSANESFSRSVLEAWAAGTAVIANASSAVVAWHCERSGGGLTYRDKYGFAAAIRLVLESAELRSALASSGGAYVRAEYRWSDVLDRIERSLTRWT